MATSSPTIHINKHDRNFTILDNSTIQDKNLSWKARGLLAYLLSLPHDWSINLSHLSHVGPDRDTATRGAMQELMEAGYIRRETRREHGRILEWRYEVYESPQSVDAPLDSDTPLVENRQVEKPIVEKQVLQSTYQTKDQVNREPREEKLSAAPQNVTPIVAKRVAKIDPLFNAICEVSGIDPYNVGPSASHIGMVKRELLTAGATPEEVYVRAGRYKRLWPMATLTPGSLLKHWAQFAEEPAHAPSYRERQAAERESNSVAAANAWLGGK